MDSFDLLGLPRRPWLDPAAVREAFQSRARILHPDAAAGDAAAFAELNAAQRELGSPASRLRLLAGETGAPSIPPKAELGFRIGAATREADALLARLRAAGTPLTRALLAPEAAEMRRRIAALASELAECESAAHRRLRECDARWPDVEGAEIAALAAEHAFLERWRAQVRERDVALAGGA